MKKIYVFVCIFLSLIPFFMGATVVDAYVSVKGYYRSNGTYVAPYIRSNPNGLKSDNYGYTGGDIYNKTYGTRDAEWDTPTYVTDPDYYEGKALYDSNQSGVSSGYTNFPVVTSVKAVRNVSYVVKAWVELNPNSDCLQSTFLRQKERQECVLYKAGESLYDWKITTDEFDGLHYMYDPKTEKINSCKDGYRSSIFNSTSAQCISESQPSTVICPIGYTCTPIEG